MTNHRDPEPSTSDIDLTPLHESGATQSYESLAGQTLEEGGDPVALEANLILIAHPENRRLGTRFRLTPGAILEIGRSPSADVCLSEVPSVSRRHARLRYAGRAVTAEDMGSTNGTFVNGELIRGYRVLQSGDRLQVAAVHFKFLHEQDVEHAYYEAIYDLVTRDGLTEIYNLRKYREEVEREFARAVRHRRPLSLILFDLDDFKFINDSYGHLCGDFVLKKATSVVKELLRPEQLFARVGGDEFAILAPETPLNGALALARKLRDRLSNADYSYCDFHLTLSCSFGVAELARTMKAPEDLYEAADRALYNSKHRGRNTVTAYSPEAER